MSTHHRFFIDPTQIEDGIASIAGQTAWQIAKVLRLKVGDEIVLLDGSGNESHAVITAQSKTSVTATVKSTGKCPGEPGLSLTLAICMPKGEKLELIVQKCTELGISRVIVANSERAVARPDGAKLEDRLTRWNRIAQEAAEQCGRGVAPSVSGIVEFSDLVSEITASPLAILAWEEERNLSLKEAIRGVGPVESAMLIIGPEGGLTQQEAGLAIAAGAKCVSLGARVLRAETAAVAACAAIMYELEGEL